MHVVLSYIVSVCTDSFTGGVRLMFFKFNLFRLLRTETLRMSFQFTMFVRIIFRRKVRYISEVSRRKWIFYLVFLWERCKISPATAEGASDICSVRKGTYFGRGRIIRSGRGCCNRLSKAWRSARCLVEYKSETPPSVARKWTKKTGERSGCPEK